MLDVALRTMLVRWACQWLATADASIARLPLVQRGIASVRYIHDHVFDFERGLFVVAANSLIEKPQLIVMDVKREPEVKSARLNSQ